MSKRKSNHQWKRVIGTSIEPKYKINNLKFSKEDKIFNKACELAKVNPTQRMASKWRNKKGTAYNFIKEAKLSI